MSKVATPKVEACSFSLQTIGHSHRRLVSAKRGVWGAPESRGETSHMPYAGKTTERKLLGYAWAAIMYRPAPVYGRRRSRGRNEADIYFFLTQAEAEAKLAALKSEARYFRTAYALELTRLPITTPRVRWRIRPETGERYTATYYGDGRAVQRAYRAAHARLISNFPNPLPHFVPR